MRAHVIRSASLVLVFVVLLCSAAAGGPFVAYSLKEAERRLSLTNNADSAVFELGGITDLVGGVYDFESRDWVLVGKINEDNPGITLDYLVVALRAVLSHNQGPEVSIDPTPETEATKMLSVRYEAGIKSTQLGLDMYNCDVTLKKMGLGKLPGQLWGVESYSSLSARHAEQATSEDEIRSQFWFENFEPPLAAREGVFAAIGLDIKVNARVQSAKIDGRQIPRDELRGMRDPVGEQFARQVTTSLSDLTVQYPILQRLVPIYNLVAMAEAMKDKLDIDPDLSFWLQDDGYTVTPVETPTQFPLLEVQERLRANGRAMTLTITGGVKVNPLVLRLMGGEVTALREAVLSSRPGPNALVWTPPLEGWEIPGLEGPSFSRADAPPPSATPGCTLDRSLRATSSPQVGLSPRHFTNAIDHPRGALPDLRLVNALPRQSFSPGVGGVMLSGSARFGGSRTSKAQVNLTDGSFSFVVEGKNTRLSPEAYRKFITALWAVYYGDQDPGISIDPIAPGVDKHLVRYIGNVLNSDLGRVMREADYMMKKWAVGTERPAIDGFSDVDGLMARLGFQYLGASRRFWFVPEDMYFKSADGMLLFDHGQMTCKTEYVLQNKAVKAEPADVAFAKFLTDHYPELGEIYPVYKDLFEYAKMVSLAKSLKESGVPLYWFLMAHKDLVLTEDSPGAVDALTKGSDHFQGLTIEGGVDLGSEGSYVYDAAAVNAINEAFSRMPSHSRSSTSLSSGKNMAEKATEPFTFDLGERSYSVLPQHSLTSGRDLRGTRYQTDVALRCDGQPGLELVRYYDPSRPEEGEFGKGWHLLTPYRVEPAGEARVDFQNLSIPAKMTVENLLTGDEETLSFSTDRYAAAGYVPEQVKSSQVVGLFIMSDASFLLVDKIGNNLGFDGAGYVTDMVFSEKHRIRYCYLDNVTDAFDEKPYRVDVEGPERTQLAHLSVPRKMRVTDMVHNISEVLTFSAEGPLAGFVPEDKSKSRFDMLAIMTDGSFRLVDKAGNETELDPAGEFNWMAVSPEAHVVKSVSQGAHEVCFNYTIDNQGKVRIAGAKLLEPQSGQGPTYAVHYDYDGEGRLCSISRSNPGYVRSLDRPQEGSSVACR